MSKIDRRSLLRFGMGGAALLGAGPLLAMTPTAGSTDRGLTLKSLHTGEQVNACYWQNGDFCDGTAELDKLLRDHRNGEQIAIDRKLYDMLYLLKQELTTEQPIEVISGYRSPATNAKLAAMGRKVAKRSFHMTGQAIDIRIPGVRHDDLHRAALALKAGGVGNYPNSGFVHIDTGRVRRWG